jgi:hypothetical protein
MIKGGFILSEYLKLPDAVERVTGHRPHLSTPWRWATRGCKGVRLETVCVGVKRLTTVEWVQSFIQALTEQRNAEQLTPPVLPPRQQERNAEKSAKKLAERLKGQGAK